MGMVVMYLDQGGVDPKLLALPGVRMNGYPLFADHALTSGGLSAGVREHCEIGMAECQWF